VEVVRRDCDARIADLEQALAEARTVDEIVASLVATLESFVAADTGVPAVLYELLSVSRQSDEIRAELAELYRRWRAHLAQALRDKQGEGIVALEEDPDAVASLLFALGDGIGLQLLTDPEWASGPALAAGV
jgi:AcrR family transcriptional regulator